MLDGIVFRACLQAKVDKVVYASSGCVYPNYLQTDPENILYLAEEVVGPPYDADNMYGWAKLMGEMTLVSYYKDWGLKSAVCRYFTVYGERGHENHAVIAMIARAFIGQNPFVVWGTGEQVRNGLTSVISCVDHPGSRKDRGWYSGKHRNHGENEVIEAVRRSSTTPASGEDRVAPEMPPAP
jgi:nucleoside-diphosphate-sugar epimerase